MDLTKIATRIASPARRIIQETSEIADTDLTVDLAMLNQDLRVVIPLELLQRAVKETDLKKRGALILAEAWTNKSDSTSDYELVIDGIEDELSWSEFLDSARENGVAV